MSVAELYGASPVNPRARATKAEMEERAQFLIKYSDQHGPVTVRGLYYRAEVARLPGIDKSDSSYKKVQRQTLLLRRAGRLAYRNISDLTRWMRKPATFDSVEEALQETARLYRKALWRDAEVHIELWCEKDALAGVVYPVTALYDVPLMPARGYSSETFCFEAVEAYADDHRPYVVYYLGDFDRAGRNAAATLEEKLKRFARERRLEVEFVTLALKEDDILDFDARNGLLRARVGPLVRRLPTREPKRKTPADKKWSYPFACELDAIEPDDLRTLVQRAIEQHLPPDQLKILKAAEDSERTLIRELVAGIGGGR